MKEQLKVRAIRSIQGKGQSIFSFFLPGSLISDVADITRVEREKKGNLKGFQRKEIQNHVNAIVEYLDQPDILFPNAIILALSPEVEFTQARGRAPAGTISVGEIGTLTLPIARPGERAAWIVDGQQRSLALAKAKNKSIPVPVVAFVADDLETQREQFILVNKARPLPSRLINELLPEVDRRLPRDLAIRRIPSELCNLLNLDPDSPFFGIIRRVSSDDSKKAVIVDSAIMKMITKSLNNPLGALSQYKGLGDESSDIESMYRILVLYWESVRVTFPRAWGLTPTRSRLMHGAGIQSMGILMDRLVPRAMMTTEPEKRILESLKDIAPKCRWTEGEWSDLGLSWNDIQNVPKHIKALSEQLIRLDLQASQKRTN